MDLKNQTRRFLTFLHVIHVLHFLHFFSDYTVQTQSSKGHVYKSGDGAQCQVMELKVS